MQFVTEVVEMFDSEHWIIYTNVSVAVVSLAVVIVTFLSLRESNRHTEHISDNTADNAQESEERIAKIAIAALHAEEQDHETPSTSPTN